MRPLAVTFATALAACGSTRPPPRPRPAPARQLDAGGSAAIVVVADTHPTDAECDTMFDHALALENAERPADQQLSAAEADVIRTKLRADHIAECRELSREAYRCLVEASTVATFGACK